MDKDSEIYQTATYLNEKGWIYAVYKGDRGYRRWRHPTAPIYLTLSEAKQAQLSLDAGEATISKCKCGNLVIQNWDRFKICSFCVIKEKARGNTSRLSEGCERGKTFPITIGQTIHNKIRKEAKESGQSLRAIAEKYLKLGMEAGA